MGYRAHSQSSTQHHLVPFLQLIFHSENGRFVFCGTFLCYISIRLMFLKNCQECTNKFRRLWAVYASNVSYIIRLEVLAQFCWHIFLHGIFVKFFCFRRVYLKQFILIRKCVFYKWNSERVQCVKEDGFPKYHYCLIDVCLCCRYLHNKEIS